ncbi:MAG: TIGR02757 family protein [Candidatus Gastranaerophilales bacterium]|nr:TIGR02757 family protein [Candidatus Gastranaerophilales bacterium]
MLKTQLDKYIEEYETKDFIKDDPIQFVHKFNKKEDIEIAGFIASMFAYGKREVFIAKLNYIFDLMENKPLEYVKSFNCKSNNIKNCDYRFSKDCDLVCVLKILNTLYSENETLETLFEYSYKQKSDIWNMFQGVVDYFYSKVNMEVTKGFYHLLPNPQKKSALKRLNMLMRWFIRKSSVDIGIWDFMPKSELLIPLDTHVAKISRKLGLLKRNDNGYESVIELTNNLKTFDSQDPVKYDFALFGYGVNNKI